MSITMTSSDRLPRLKTRVYARVSIRQYRRLGTGGATDE